MGAEVAAAAGKVELDTRAELELRWLHRNGAEPGATNLLEPTIRRRESYRVSIGS